MNIGEEEEDAKEYPFPAAPGKNNPIHEPSPQVAPVEEPAHAGWNEYEQLDLEYLARVCKHG